MAGVGAARATFELLAARPGIAWAARFRGPVLGAVRCCAVRGLARQRVLCRPMERGIDILRARPGARDIEPAIFS